jgi:hypothetical protein
MTLFFKLNLYGIEGEAGQWSTSYLDRRKQRVKITPPNSNWGIVKHGVPQGSVLGPLIYQLSTPNNLFSVGWHYLWHILNCYNRHLNHLAFL